MAPLTGCRFSCDKPFTGCESGIRQEQGIDYEIALDYLDKAIELDGDTYYFHRVKSLVEAALGDYESAIQSAERSLELAEKEEKDEFVRMNQENIILWKKK